MSPDEMGFESHYGGMEPVNIDNLDDVTEQKLVISATKNVKFRIRKVEARANKKSTYRWLSLHLQLVNGIDEEGKYRNKVLFSNLCYYADPTVYDKDFFKTRQHLVQLKYLSKATQLDLSRLDGHKIEELTGIEILGDILISKGMEEGTQDNVVKNFKRIAEEQLV